MQYISLHSKNNLDICNYYTFRILTFLHVEIQIIYVKVE